MERDKDLKIEELKYQNEKLKVMSDGDRSAEKSIENLLNQDGFDLNDDP